MRLSRVSAADATVSDAAADCRSSRPSARERSCGGILTRPPAAHLRPRGYTDRHEAAADVVWPPSSWSPAARATPSQLATSSSPAARRRSRATPDHDGAPRRPACRPRAPARRPMRLPPPAEPGQAPAPTGTPPGRIVPVGDAPEGVVVDAVTRTVAVAKRNPNELVLMNADTGDVTDACRCRGRPPSAARQARRPGSGSRRERQRPGARRPPRRQGRTADHHRHRSARRIRGAERHGVRRQRARRHDDGASGATTSSRCSPTACSPRAWHRSAT